MRGADPAPAEAVTAAAAAVAEKNKRKDREGKDKTQQAQPAQQAADGSSSENTDDEAYAARHAPLEARRIPPPQSALPDSPNPNHLLRRQHPLRALCPSLPASTKALNAPCCSISLQALERKLRLGPAPGRGSGAVGRGQSQGSDGSAQMALQPTVSAGEWMRQTLSFTTHSACLHVYVRAYARAVHTSQPCRPRTQKLRKLIVCALSSSLQ